MAFNVTEFRQQLFSSKRKNLIVKFQSEELKDCIALASELPTDAYEWEVEIFEDENDNYRYRDIFERWLNNLNMGVIRRESVMVDSKETPELIPVYVSSCPCCAYNEEDRFTVKFLVNPLPF